MDVSSAILTVNTQRVHIHVYLAHSFVVGSKTFVQRKCVHGHCQSAEFGRFSMGTSVYHFEVERIWLPQLHLSTPGT